MIPLLQSQFRSSSKPRILNVCSPTEGLTGAWTLTCRGLLLLCRVGSQIISLRMKATGVRRQYIQHQCAELKEFSLSNHRSTRPI